MEQTFDEVLSHIKKILNSIGSDYKYDCDGIIVKNYLNQIP